MHVQGFNQKLAMVTGHTSSSVMFCIASAKGSQWRQLRVNIEAPQKQSCRILGTWIDMAIVKPDRAIIYLYQLFGGREPLVWSDDLGWVDA